MNKTKKSFAGALVTRLLLLSIIAFGTASASASPARIQADSNTITIDMQKKTVKEVLDYIESRTGYVFFYGHNSINADSIVSIQMNNATVPAVLKQLFQGSGVDYKIQDKQVSLHKSGQASPKQAKQPKKQANKRKITGTIVDAATNEPLIGVSVQVKGSKGVGTVTDIDGFYSIDVTNRNELDFSYVGYSKQTLSQ